MKVYLINPPAAGGVKMVREGRCMQRKGAWTTVWPPVTLAVMAGMLLKEGIEVKLDDCITQDITYNKLKLRIAEFKPDLVVINTATASIYSDLHCAKISKAVSADIRTLAFGLHVTVLPEEAFLMEAGLDYVIRGEPEFCFLELIKALKQNNNLSEIKGLSYRSDSMVQHNPERGFNDDLNNLTFPAWELIDVNKYLLPLTGEPFLLVTTSKGCPHRCIFCPAKPFYGSRLRFRRHEIIADEMAYNKKRFGVGQFLIWSESFTEDRDFVIRFCDEILKRRLNVGWVCNSRVDKVDLRMLELMKKAGCWMIGYGIESGCQEILDSVKKDITVQKIEEAVRLANEAKIEVTAHITFGLPKETFDTGLKTIKWLNKLDIDFAQIYCAVPWPSTLLYHIAQEKKWLTTSDWRLYEQNHCVLDMGTISPKQVEYLRKMAMRRFYLSAKRLFMMARKINSFKKAWIFIKMIKEFVSWM